MRRFSSGFTLLELSIVLMVLSVMIGGVMAALTVNVKQQQRVLLEKRMEEIKKALYDFRLKNNRLPCPGGFDLPIGNTNYGVEGAPLGYCVGGTPSAGYVDTDADVLAYGMVPVRTLGLPDEYALDPWGNKFTYTISFYATVSAQFALMMDNGSYAEEIEIKDGNGDAITNDVIVVLLSHGPNGHGAYMENGIKKVAGSYNADEWENCNCEDDGVITNPDREFVQRLPTHSSVDPANNFDDYVDYMSLADFMGAAELRTETVPFTY